MGNKVFILFRAKKPVLLRPKGDGVYSFLDEVLLLDTKYNYLDIMYGALYREEDGTQEVE